MPRGTFLSTRLYIHICAGARAPEQEYRCSASTRLLLFPFVIPGPKKERTALSRRFVEGREVALWEENFFGSARLPLSGVMVSDGAAVREIEL